MFKYRVSNICDSLRPTQAVYSMYGVYRSFMTRYKNIYDVDKVPTQTAYFANVKRAKTKEGLLP